MRNEHRLYLGTCNFRVYGKSVRRVARHERTWVRFWTPATDLALPNLIDNELGLTRELSARNNLSKATGRSVRGDDLDATGPCRCLA